MANQRWYPSANQLKDPESIERSFRQLLTQHYDLIDRHQALVDKVNAPVAKPTGPPPGSGPVDTQLLGLRVAPVDTDQLANGATLKWNKVNGNFEIS